MHKKFSFSGTGWGQTILANFEVQVKSQVVHEKLSFLEGVENCPTWPTLSGHSHCTVLRRSIVCMSN